MSISLLLNMMFYSLPSADEKIPDDIRYMLEDLYGENKNHWPSPIFKKDLNNDGLLDWIAKKKNCQSEKPCSTEVFICIPNKTGKCSEYCYIEVKPLVIIEEAINQLRCESTC